ncbi:MAG: CidA/LrgA family protein [Treponema sp.]|jgi:holin-like protein|nr:CidA/LrgA family protein [Treponema sp.]
MNIFKQLGIILAFGFAGEIIARFIPMGMPSSVLGMILMLAALGFRILKPEHLGATADFLSANMAFFFLPAVVTVLRNFDLVRSVVWRLLFICCVCSGITFGISYGTVWLCRKIMSSGRTRRGKLSPLAKKEN